MKHMLCFLVLSLHLLFAESSLTTELAPKKVAIAVMEFDGAGLDSVSSSVLSNRLRALLVSSGEYRVVERAQMAVILEEQGFQQTGCVDSECMVEMGRLIGVEKIVVGSVDKIGQLYALNIKLVNVESGEIEEAATTNCKSCQMEDVLTTSLTELLANLGAAVEAPAVVALPVVNPEVPANYEYYFANKVDIAVKGVLVIKGERLTTTLLKAKAAEINSSSLQTFKNSQMIMMIGSVVYSVGLVTMLSSFSDIDVDEDKALGKMIGGCSIVLSGCIPLVLGGRIKRRGMEEYERDLRKFCNILY